MNRNLRIGGKAVDPTALDFQPYRKLPVVIQAVQIDEPFEVDTLEGTHQGSPGDYLIRGIKGELYPCKPDIFYETYVKAEAEWGEEDKVEWGEWH